MRHFGAKIKNPECHAAGREGNNTRVLLEPLIRSGSVGNTDRRHKKKNSTQNYKYKFKLTN